MSRFLFTSLLLTAIASSGCTDYSPSVFVRQAQIIDREDECLVENDPSAGALFSGKFDPQYGDGYFAALLVGNQLIRRGDEDQLKPEANRVQFYEAEVQLLGQDGSTQGDAFFQTISGFADPATGEEPGYGVAGVMLIPPGGAAAGPVVARVIVRGVTLGGEDVETAFWDFPILVTTLDCIELPCEEEIVCPCYEGQEVEADCRCSGGPTACQ